MKYDLIEVVNRRTENEFLETAREINKNYPNWVPPLDMEIRSIFNPKKNKMFEGGKARRWIVKHKGKLVGRIAAFYNLEKAHRYKIPTGGIGFFESIDNSEVANLLFDTARAWLEKEGMKAMDGPVNFGENDRHWGLLVKGFEFPPAIGMPYNPPYYEKFFTDYGFEVYFEQISKHLDLTRPMPERFTKIWNWIKNKSNIKFDYAKKKNIMKYAYDFMKVYNEAWKNHEHFVPMTEQQVEEIARDLKPILIEKFMLFAYVDDEPAGILLALPDLNQIFKPFRGKPSLIDMLKFAWRKRNDYLWYRKRNILNRARVLIIGVVPKYQKYGLEVGMTMANMDDAREMGFIEAELSWVGDFNPLSRRLQDATGATLGKIHRTYRLVFNPEDRKVLKEKEIIKQKR